MNRVVLTGWSLACLNRQSLFFVYCCILLHTKRLQQGGGPGSLVPERSNAGEGPVEDCLSSQVDGAEIRALFQLLQDKAKQKRERGESEIVSVPVGEQDGSSKVKP